ncbi:threonine aldolase family protein [Streptomyces sp. TR06-5]|uniref:threonine aldolase family protein n=1 Tax=unclassified Streptomyces TaxID=2593676 RepID=UPI0039A1CEE8
MGKQTMRQRRRAALAQCERVLSHSRRPTMRQYLERLADHDLDGPPDAYGDGPVSVLERRVSDLLGTEDAVFFPTGTMAQQVALRCWAGRTGNPTVALHPRAHPEVHEGGALQAVSGLRTVHPTREERLPLAGEVHGLDEPFGTLMLELPLREAGFVLPSWEELTAVVGAARDREAVVHLDGARLWECTEHFGRSLAEIADLADSVYVSFYKSLEGISGAALCASADVVAEARTWRHRYGGLVFQQWPAALAALHGLEHELPRLPGHVAHAKIVAAALRDALTDEVPFFRVHPVIPCTHQFQVWLPYPARTLDEAGVRQAEQTGTAVFGPWQDAALPGLATTEVTVSASAAEWSADDVAEGVGSFLRFVRDR